MAKLSFSFLSNCLTLVTMTMMRKEGLPRINVDEMQYAIFFRLLRFRMGSLQIKKINVTRAFSNKGRGTK